MPFFSQVVIVIVTERSLTVNKEKIVGAAFRVWGRNFYQKTSLSQLAGELGVSKPALYRHFSNKQALIKAMTERFFDDFADSIREEYEETLRHCLSPQIKSTADGIFAIIMGIAGFYGRNVYAFIFSLINVYDRNKNPTSTEQLKARNVDMGALHQIFQKEYTAEPVGMQLIFATLTFFMAEFHKTKKTFENIPSEEEIQKTAYVICESIKCGLDYKIEVIKTINFDELEKLAEKKACVAEPEPLFKAVAEAVAEAGPWKASMEMVAKRLGLSKSSLYGHFKNKKDMLRRLFIGEFRRIIEFARQGIKLSQVPEEQLYLGIYSIAVYLRSRPEFLVSLDWIRTRKLDLGKSEKQNEIFRLFEDVAIERLQNSGEDEKRRMSHWIMFLLINIMMRTELAENRLPVFRNADAQKNDIRLLYRFVILGLKGFKQ